MSRSKPKLSAPAANSRELATHTKVYALEPPPSTTGSAESDGASRPASVSSLGFDEQAGPANATIHRAATSTLRCMLNSCTAAARQDDAAAKLPRSRSRARVWRAA